MGMELLSVSDVSTIIAFPAAFAAGDVSDTVSLLPTKARKPYTEAAGRAGDSCPMRSHRSDNSRTMLTIF
jgi:hypothetical protein